MIFGLCPLGSNGSASGSVKSSSDTSTTIERLSNLYFLFKQLKSKSLKCMFPSCSTRLFLLEKSPCHLIYGKPKIIRVISIKNKLIKNI